MRLCCLLFWSSRWSHSRKPWSRSLIIISSVFHACYCELYEFDSWWGDWHMYIVRRISQLWLSYGYLDNVVFNLLITFNFLPETVHFFFNDYNTDFTFNWRLVGHLLLNILRKVPNACLQTSCVDSKVWMYQKTCSSTTYLFCSNSFKCMVFADILFRYFSHRKQVLIACLLIKL